MEEKRPLVWLSAAYPDFLASEPVFRGWRLLYYSLMPMQESSGYAIPDLNPEARVGVFDTSALASDALAALEKTLECLPLERWVAIVEADQLRNPELRRLIQRFCTDYHTRPLQPQRLGAFIGHLWGMSVLQASLPDTRSGTYQNCALVGNSPGIVRVRDLLQRFAQTDEPVHIDGENGTGKEAAAKYIHGLSARRSKPLVVVNCAALPPSLTQNELFGHEKGAFTHAMSAQKGRIEAAHGGTLLLMGIDELSTEQQSAILRFLQEGVIERLGSTHPIRIDTRLIATSTRPLDQLVEVGAFRSDVFYRLGSLHVRMPPLRDRRMDLPALVTGLLSATASGGRVLRLTDSATVCLTEHSWPGNLRELQNRLGQALLLSEGVCIEPHDLGFPVATDNARTELSLDAFRSRADREAISVSLALARNNVSAAARLLRISRVSMYRLMEKHQLHHGKAGWNTGRE